MPIQPRLILQDWQSASETAHALHVQDAVAQLRSRIAKIEGHQPGLDDDVRAAAWMSGHAALDAALGAKADEGLSLGALHEIAPLSPPDLPVASAFAFGLLARLKRQGPVFWCMSGGVGREYGALYAPGLMAFGINPARVICVHVRQPKDLSFVLEEASRLSSLAAIIAEGPLPSFTASRRLALLLAQSQVPMLFLPDGRSSEGSAAATRLVVEPLVAAGDGMDPASPGPPAFRVTLARNRGGRPGLSFEMVFDYASLSFAPLPVASLSGASSDSISDGEFPLDVAPKWQRSA